MQTTKTAGVAITMRVSHLTSDLLHLLPVSVAFSVFTLARVLLFLAFGTAVSACKGGLNPISQI